uniref:Venom cub domain protein 2 n=1 Tax=Pristhesancus plagipennis TaxID=1955184 RepID=A0A1Q1NPA2_PRIPG|nr:venom cub domain protein 2 [Pristhesancus plagipennis]
MRAIYLCLVLFIAAVAADVQKLEVPPGKEVDIESENYPEDANANSDLKWELSTTSGHVINLKCSDIRLFEEKPCGPWVLRITDGDETEELCTTKFDYEKKFKTNKILVNFKTGPEARGFLQCTATAVKK